jgi:hypothetical protein
MSHDSLRTLVLTASALALASCGNDMPSGPQGGPVNGAADTHCIAADGGVIAQQTSQTACQERPADAAPADANPVDAAPQSDYGPTLFNQSGDDDDCKYHVEWTSSPIYENYDVTFHIVVTTKWGNQPATGAKPYAEILLSDTHGAPPTDQHGTETSPGHYDVGPVQFDAPGNWTVRFHVYSDCLDLVDTSPHGHAAFFVKVP